MTITRPDRLHDRETARGDLRRSIVARGQACRSSARHLASHRAQLPRLAAAHRGRWSRACKSRSTSQTVEAETSRVLRRDRQSLPILRHRGDTLPDLDLRGLGFGADRGATGGRGADGIRLLGGRERDFVALVGEWSAD